MGEESPPATAPAAWVAIDGDDGLFYYNEETGESQWDPPAEWIGDVEDDRKSDAPCEQTQSPGHSRVDRSPSRNEVGESIGAQPDTAYFKVHPRPGKSSTGGARLRAVVPDNALVGAWAVGAQAALTGAPGLLFRIEAIGGEGGSGDGGDVRSEGEAFVDLACLDRRWPGIESEEYDGVLTVLQAANDLEEAIFSAIRTLVRRQRQVDLPADEGPLAADSTDVLTRVKDLFPEMVGDMTQEQMEEALESSLVLEVVVDEDGVSRVATRAASSPLEETTMRAFDSLTQQKHLFMPLSSERPWRRISDQLSDMLGVRDEDLDRRLLETSPHFDFTYSEVRAHWVIRLRRPPPDAQRKVERVSSQQPAARERSAVASERSAPARERSSGGPKLEPRARLRTAPAAPPPPRLVDKDRRPRAESVRSREDRRTGRREESRHEGAPPHERHRERTNGLREEGRREEHRRESHRVELRRGDLRDDRHRVDEQRRRSSGRSLELRRAGDRRSPERCRSRHRHREPDCRSRDKDRARSREYRGSRSRQERRSRSRSRGSQKSKPTIADRLAALLHKTDDDGPGGSTARESGKAEGTSAGTREAGSSSAMTSRSSRMAPPLAPSLSLRSAATAAARPSTKARQGIDDTNPYEKPERQSVGPPPLRMGMLRPRPKPSPGAPGSAVAGSSSVASSGPAAEGSSALLRPQPPPGPPPSWARARGGPTGGPPPPSKSRPPLKPQPSGPSQAKGVVKTVGKLTTKVMAPKPKAPWQAARKASGLV